MATWNELRKPKFSDKEIAACKWIEDCGVRGWLVNLATKGITYSKGRRGSVVKFASLNEFAESLGWNPECK